MKKNVLTLLLILILGNVAYWVINKRFLHDDVMAMITGKAATSEQVINSDAARAAQALVAEAQIQTPELAIPSEVTADVVATEAEFDQASVMDQPQLSEKEQMNAMIQAVKAEIEALQIQQADINEDIATLESKTDMADQKIQDIGSNYSLSPEQLEQLSQDESTGPLDQF